MDAKLKPGATVPVTFTFSQGAKLAANFAVRSATGK
jgi:copper(I)-binding protein